MNVTTRLQFASLFVGLLFFLDLNDFASLEIAAIGAHEVRQAFVSAVGANDKIRQRQGVLRTAAVTASFGMFALGMWGHETFSFIHTSDGQEPVWVGFERSGLIIYAGDSDVKAKSL